MDLTPNLSLPYILAAQAQKHVTHNEALGALDTIVHLSVLDRDLATPPSSPAEGARYLVAASPTGAWTGQAGKIAAWQDGAWVFYAAQEGWVCWIGDEDKLVACNGTSFADVVSSGAIQSVPMVGINTTADTTDRLAVSSAAVLFNHAGAGHQVKVNKNAAGDTASFLFQTGFSGRAEIGTIGNNDFQFKVSADGSTWNVAICIDDATGRVGIGTTSPETILHVASDTYQWMYVSYSSNDGNAPTYVTRKSRGTHASKSAVADGDYIFSLEGWAYDGANYKRGAYIAAVVNGAPAGSNMPTEIAFATNSGGADATERLRVTKGGHVGIGTSSPDRRLHAELDDATTSAVSYVGRLTHTTAGTPANGIGVGLEFEVETSAGNYEVGATIEVVAIDTTAASEDFALNLKTMAGGAAAASRIYLTPQGNVGINTTSPTDWGSQYTVLDARGNTTAQSGYFVATYSDGSLAGYFGADNGNAYFSGSPTTPLIFRTNAADRMKIQVDGNIRIGTGPASTKLDVDGPVRVKSYAVAGVPSASAIEGAIIYVSDEAGGAVLAFSDGTNWRRVTDRAVVS